MAKSKTLISKQTVFRQPVLRQPVSLEEYLRVFNAETRQLNQQLSLVAEKGPAIIHDLRVTIKRLRALNLLIKHIDRQTYSQNNNSLRAVAKRFSGTRDREVIYATLQKLIQKNPHLKSDPVTQNLLLRHRPISLYAGGDFIDKSTEPPLALSPIEQPVDDNMMTTGLVANYRCCRKLWIKAFETSDDCTFHRWRRFVKYHYYQLSYFDFKKSDVKGSTSIERSLKQQLKQSKKLGSILGKDHDLFMLKKLLNPLMDSQPLLDALTDRRQLLRLEEETLGEKLFSEKPKVFRRRLTFAWHNTNSK